MHPLEKILLLMLAVHLLHLWATAWGCDRVFRTALLGCMAIVSYLIVRIALSVVGVI